MRKSRLACFPGTFDPPTLGHLDLIRRGAALFDELVVAVGVNAAKAPLFSAEERVEMLRRMTEGMVNVRVASFQGLAVEFCRREGVSVILRGLRTPSDFEFEFQMAFTNRELDGSVETLFMLPGDAYVHTSSRLIREIVRAGGAAARYLDPEVEQALRARLLSS